MAKKSRGRRGPLVTVVMMRTRKDLRKAGFWFWISYRGHDTTQISGPLECRIHCQAQEESLEVKLRVRYLLLRLSRMIILNKIILKKLQKHSDAPLQTLYYFCFSIVFFVREFVWRTRSAKTNWSLYIIKTKTTRPPNKVWPWDLVLRLT